MEEKKKRWFGPKFKDYLKLNFRMVWIEYGVLLIAGLLIYPDEPQELPAAFVLIVAVATLECLRVFQIIGSKSLYQKDAYLYQSFPVSDFEVMVAKTLVMSGALAMAPFIMVAVHCREHWMLLPVILTAASAVSGIIMFAIGIGNNFRERSATRPSVFVSAALVVVLLGMQLWAAAKFAGWDAVDGSVKCAVLATVCLVEAGFLLRMNWQNLKNHYSL